MNKKITTAIILCTAVLISSTACGKSVKTVEIKPSYLQAENKKETVKPKNTTEATTYAEEKQTIYFRDYSKERKEQIAAAAPKADENENNAVNKPNSGSASQKQNSRDPKYITTTKPPIKNNTKKTTAKTTATTRDVETVPVAERAQSVEDGKIIEGETEDPNTKYISLSDSRIAIDGSGIAAKTNEVVIYEGGIYQITGKISDLQIIVDAPKQNVTLTLLGLNIENSDTAIYIYNTTPCTINLYDNSHNSITTNSKDAEAAIFSEGDIYFTGYGSLDLSNFKNGIKANGTVHVTNSDIKIKNASEFGIYAYDVILNNCIVDADSKLEQIRRIKD